MTVRHALAPIFAATLLACGGGGGNNSGSNGNPTGPPAGGGAANGSMTATIGGAAWSAAGTVSVTRQQNNFIGIGASGFAGGTAYAVVIGIANAVGPGTHNLDIYTGGGDGSSLIVGGQTTGWGTAFQGGSGTVTITSLSANRIVGTFSGILIPSSGTAANLVVANGQFNVTF